MGETAALTKLGAEGQLIWGDDAETNVCAQAYGISQTIIFRFTIDEKDMRPLLSRIVNCYHDKDVPGPEETFPDRPAMRAVLWSAVASVWLQCLESPIVGELDTIVDITGIGSWKCVAEPLFAEYLSRLPQPADFADQGLSETVEYGKLTRLQQLGGRGCTTLVQTTSNRETKMVYKGVDFQTFLFAYESGLFTGLVQQFRGSAKLLWQKPTHPNILPAPQIMVTIWDEAHKRNVVCGCLFPFYHNGDIAGKIDDSNASGIRIASHLKAKWCQQMAAAVAHTHYVAHTFHMDIKPGNFVLDNDSNALLIDWEQSDAPVTTAAPEIDGSWDAQEIEETTADGSIAVRVKYSKYDGPERRNMPENTPGNKGWNVWNSLLHWRQHCPKASELAEVFSLGRTNVDVAQAVGWRFIRRH